MVSKQPGPTAKASRSAWKKLPNDYKEYDLYTGSAT